MTEEFLANVIMTICLYRFALVLQRFLFFVCVAMVAFGVIVITVRPLQLATRFLSI